MPRFSLSVSWIIESGQAYLAERAEANRQPQIGALLSLRSAPAPALRPNLACSVDLSQFLLYFNFEEGITMRITQGFLSLSVLLFGVSRASSQEVTHQEVWSSFTPAERYILGSPTMTYRYGGVSATSQVLGERRAAMQAQRDAPLYPAFGEVQALIAAEKAAAEERAAAYASTQDTGKFWRRYNSVARGWVPQP